MSALQAIVLGIVQGLTEFLPISSTAHLRIVSAFFGWDDPGAAFTAVIQLGTMAAVLLYFREDLLRVARTFLAGCATRPARRPRLQDGLVPHPRHGPDRRLRPRLQGPDRERRPRPYLIGSALILFSFVMLLAERVAGASRESRSSTRATPRYRLRPGARAHPGRLALGLDDLGRPVPRLHRVAAARYCFLLCVPAVVLSGLFELRKVGEHNGAAPAPTIIATILAFLVGYASIAWLLRFLAHHTLRDLRDLPDRARRARAGAHRVRRDQLSGSRRADERRRHRSAEGQRLERELLADVQREALARVVDERDAGAQALGRRAARRPRAAPRGGRRRGRPPRRRRRRTRDVAEPQPGELERRGRARPCARGARRARRARSPRARRACGRVGAVTSSSAAPRSSTRPAAASPRPPWPARAARPTGARRARRAAPRGRSARRAARSAGPSPGERQARSPSPSARRAHAQRGLRRRCRARAARRARSAGSASKRTCWQREAIVGSTLPGRSVSSTRCANAGGSSSVLSILLAAVDHAVGAPR